MGADWAAVAPAADAVCRDPDLELALFVPTARGTLVKAAADSRPLAAADAGRRLDGARVTVSPRGAVEPLIWRREC